MGGHLVQVTLHGNHGELEDGMAPDGTFRVEDVPAGSWYLDAEIMSFPKEGGLGKIMGAAGRTFIVPEMSGGRSDEPLDLGTLEPGWHISRKLARRRRRWK